MENEIYFTVKNIIRKKVQTQSSYHVRYRIWREFSKELDENIPENFFFSVLNQLREDIRNELN